MEVESKGFMSKWLLDFFSDQCKKLRENCVMVCLGHCAGGAGHWAQLCLGELTNSLHFWDLLPLVVARGLGTVLKVEGLLSINTDVDVTLHLCLIILAGVFELVDDVTLEHPQLLLQGQGTGRGRSLSIRRPGLVDIDSVQQTLVLVNQLPVLSVKSGNQLLPRFLWSIMYQRLGLRVSVQSAETDFTVRLTQGTALSLLFCTKCIFHMRGTSDSSPPAGVERAAPLLSADIDTSMKEPVEEPVEGRGLCKWHFSSLFDINKGESGRADTVPLCWTWRIQNE